MSAGRWVWVPEGWKVVPKSWTTLMMLAFPGDTDCREVTQEDIDNALAFAPDPPSGWQQGNPPSRGPWLGYDPTLGPIYEYFAGYFDTLERNEWWTPLPPPPEVKP